MSSVIGSVFLIRKEVHTVQCLHRMHVHVYSKPISLAGVHILRGIKFIVVDLDSMNFNHHSVRHLNIYGARRPLFQVCLHARCMGSNCNPLCSH